MKKTNELILCKRSIDTYCESLVEAGRQAKTIEKYRTYLAALYNFLPQNKVISGEQLSIWKQTLIEEYSSFKTVNVIVSIVNGYLVFNGRRDLLVETVKATNKAAAHSLTRNEYLRLLQAAKHQNNERLYLIIKTFVTMGIPVGELERFTVESLQNGHVAENNDSGSIRYVPTPLGVELKSYVDRNGINRGPIFCTKNGNPVDRSNIVNEMKNLSKEARVDPGKCNPRSFIKLYTSTREHINDEMTILAERAYNRILESEQTVCGWDRQ